MREPRCHVRVWPSILKRAIATIHLQPPRATQKIDYGKYFQFASVLSTIAAAIVTIAPRSSPLRISKSRKVGELILTFTCSDEKVQKATSVIRFHDFGDKPLLPRSFDFAG